MFPIQPQQGVFFLTLFTLGSILVYAIFRKVWKRQITATPHQAQTKGAASRPTPKPQAIPKIDPQSRTLPQVKSKPKSGSSPAPAEEPATPGGEVPSAEHLAAEAERLKVLGNQAIGAKDYLSALKHYTDAIESQPNAILHGNRSLVLSNLQNYTAALEDANTSIKLDPTYVRAYQRKVTALTNLARHEEAHQVAVAALKLDPQNSVIQKLKNDLEKHLPQPPVQQVEVIDEDDLVQEQKPTFAEVVSLPSETESQIPTVEEFPLPTAESAREDFSPLQQDTPAEEILGNLPEVTEEPESSVRTVTEIVFNALKGEQEESETVSALDEEQSKQTEEPFHTPEEAPEEWPSLSESVEPAEAEEEKLEQEPEEIVIEEVSPSIEPVVVGDSWIDLEEQEKEQPTEQEKEEPTKQTTDSWIDLEEQETEQKTEQETEQETEQSIKEETPEVVQQTDEKEEIQTVPADSEETRLYEFEEEERSKLYEFSESGVSESQPTEPTPESHLYDFDEQKPAEGDSEEKSWSDVVQEAPEEEKVTEESPLEDEQATPAEEILGNLPEVTEEPESSVRTVTEIVFNALKGEQEESEDAPAEPETVPALDNEEWPAL